MRKGELKLITIDIKDFTPVGKKPTGN